MTKTKVFIISSGLGETQRGFETVFLECFNAVVSCDELDVHLFRGGSRIETGTRLWTLRRNSKLAKAIGVVLGRSGYFVEQFLFFISLLPFLILHRPDVVYVADLALSNMLRVPRKILSFKILLHNGGATLTRFLMRYDHIHQMLPEYYDQAVREGVPKKKQTLLPCGVDITPELSCLSELDCKELRRQLRLPLDASIILSVASISKSCKRIDYLISEIASLPSPRPFLLVVGAWGDESRDIVSMGRKLLPNNFDVRTVEKNEVYKYYQVSDVFVLASLREGFGLSQVEALSFGLPCIVHDYSNSRQVLGNMGYYADLSEPGGLVGVLSDIPQKNSLLAEKRHQYAYERYGWDFLEMSYVKMFQRCSSPDAY